MALPCGSTVLSLLDQYGMLPLTLATLLLLATAIDARRDARRPLWLRLAVRIGVFGILTWLLQYSVGSPVMPRFPTHSPGERVWAQFVEIGWWMLGARVAVDILRVVVVLENRPRETKIVSDLLAGGIYIATALAVTNFAFGIPIGGLVAGSGVIAIVLGLALQNTLSDVFSGIAVGLEHAYKAGDLLWVEGGVEGQVLQINWRSTQIATPNNSIAIVPNSVIAKSRLENRSAPTPTRGVTVSVGLAAAADPRRCLAALNAAVQACQLPLAQPEPKVVCVGLQGDGVTYEIRFVVASTSVVASARTEMFNHVQRHLRYAGISLAISNIAPPPPQPAPTLHELMAESELFGPLSDSDRAMIVEHLVPITREPGETLFCEGEMPAALFLIASGTVEVAKGDGAAKQVVLRASPGDTVGMIALITGEEAVATARVLTPVTAYSLDKAAIAAVLRQCPDLASIWEAQAKRGLAWLQCEVAAHQSDSMHKPDMLLVRLRQFLRRLSV
jgi:small-conductance mechanosensitive channel/CRP-like cAMP-binding protein